MQTPSDDVLVQAIRDAAYPLHGVTEDYDPLMELIGEARLVLLGEGSHGTHEFYEARAHITRRLIEERGFTAVIVEADWPDAYRVNQYVRGAGNIGTSLKALGNFERFPRWMWRNHVVLTFIDWLREYNDALPAGQPKSGFYGMDLYSLYSSIELVLRYLDRVDPEAAARARERYTCFEQFGEDSQSYGYAASLGLSESCETEVLNELLDIQEQATTYRHRDGQVAEDDYFYTEQNARLVKNAEAYYRSMFEGRVISWNLRDQHMVETVNELLRHLDQRDGQTTRAVIWAHNSHLGDARATEMGEIGELNVGQLLRDQYGDQAVLVGFTTYGGTVTAATEWEGEAQHMQVRPALPESYEWLFHQTKMPAFLLNLIEDSTVTQALMQTRLERAIGVIYRPETERVSHYFRALLPEQFDAVIHFDESRAVEPLDRDATWNPEATPETYPYGV